MTEVSLLLSVPTEELFRMCVKDLEKALEIEKLYGIQHRRLLQLVRHSVCKERNLPPGLANFQHLTKFDKMDVGERLVAAIPILLDSSLVEYAMQVSHLMTSEQLKSAHQMALQYMKSRTSSYLRVQFEITTPAG